MRNLKLDVNEEWNTKNNKCMPSQNRTLKDIIVWDKMHQEKTNM